MTNEQKLCNVLVNYSCKIQQGEKVFIETKDVPQEFVTELIQTVYKAGGLPFLVEKRSICERELMLGMTEEYLKNKVDFELPVMKAMDAYIGVRGTNNKFELCDIPQNIRQMHDKEMRKVLNQRVDHTKWVILNFPTPALAQSAGMSTAQFAKFFYNVCTLNYSKMDKAMEPLVNLMQKTNTVHLTAKGTDLTFSIKGIKAIKCSGERNIPDGEVYTAPVKDSVNGTITFNVPTTYNGISFSNISLTFQNGKIITASGDKTEQLNKILDTDEGARYIGEFAIGVNPFITKPMQDILFDEKMAGSIHFTPGCCYEEASNGNKSAIHWDMVLCQSAEHGGGELWFDNVLIRKDGRFIPKELLCLNPENLI